MLSTTLLTTLLTTTTALALPLHNPLAPRAGGPAYTPIPATCPVYTVLPVSLSSSPPHYAPLASVDAANQVYAAYWDPASTNDTDLYIGCLEQCNGLSGCKAAYIAWEVPTPAGYYGTPGGELMTGCLMYNRTLVAGDFGAAKEGTHRDGRMGNLSCK
ncbi:uncharacterized protein BDZ99DRAFT_574459 [Mytilinidion resinicola]|uniref:Apple domain-containing protein n=1 Tax=Mytilinidion resinicola TaxID=574789 RepID=A0A6A6YA88_9PEZI|nr:uncharacterized protein BDZ99DRAFT_574459 [Mytilinidion resinicola]KAF2805539.1 hypothetical protein BDZ99DRAFT_574459 [Mytilinidion resinicola]